MPTMTADVRYRPLVRAELDLLLAMAAAEGWNPGAGDAAAFWDADPEGFLGVERDGELVGGVSAVATAGAQGFIGLFLVRPDLRSQGLGGPVFARAVESLRDRLGPDAPIALDGVMEREDYYSRQGFVRCHVSRRMEGTGAAALAAWPPSWPADAAEALRVVPLAALAFDDVVAFDAQHYGAARPDFLRRWITPAGGLALGAVDPDGSLRAAGVVRPCVTGFKVGPLFALDAGAARLVLRGLLEHVGAATVVLDVPDVNADAVALAAALGWTEVFGCVRMVLGPVPALPWDRIYGLTTFELG